MRIGIDCRAYGSSHGYIGKYIENLISYLEQSEDTNEYVLFLNDHEAGEFTSKSPRFYIVKTSVKMGGIAEQILFPYELSREKLDVMFFPHPSIPLFYLGKSIILLSDLVPYFYPEKNLNGIGVRYWQNFLLRKSIEKSSIIIASSEILKRDIIEIFDTHEEKIHIIPPMYIMVGEGKIFEENEIKQFLTKEGINERYILSVGDLREYKNIPRFLQAYNLFLKENEFSETSQKRSNLNEKGSHSSPVEGLPQGGVRSITANEETEFGVQRTSFSDVSIDLVLVGKEDPTYHEIRSTLIQLGLQSRVHIYNILEEEKIELLYQNASLYALPSLYEGSEETILTPLTYKLPLISSVLPSITSLITKDDAIFFRPMSIGEIKEALKKALLQPPMKQRKRDMSIFSPASVSEKIYSLLVFNKEE